MSIYLLYNLKNFFTLFIKLKYLYGNILFMQNLFSLFFLCQEIPHLLQTKFYLIKLVQLSEKNFCLSKNLNMK